MPEQISIRELALDVIISVDRDNVPIHLALRDMLEKYQYLSKTDRSFLTKLAEGTIEKKISIDYQISQYSKTKLNKMRPFIRNLLRMSTYQILYLDKVPDSAACNEAVKLARKRGFNNLTGFVNGVLRSLSRGKEHLNWPDKNNELQYLSVTYSMPEYLVKEFLDQYGRRITEKILRQFQKEAPFTVRFSYLHASGEMIRESLQKDGASCEKADFGQNAWILSGVDHPYALEAFRNGWIQIQDISSQLAVECAGIRPGMQVMDLCAAPGGKSLYAAELLQQGDDLSGYVTARDLTESKCAMITENAKRLGITNLTAQVYDACVPDPSRKESADLLIADLPCSGYGVIGRKPDIRYHADKEKEHDLVKLQRQILAASADYVRPGGVLLYSTCTLNKEENEENADWIAKNLPFQPESLDPYLPEFLRNEETASGHLQLLPGIHPCDGFFIARFRKV